MRNSIAELKKRFPDWTFPPDSTIDDPLGKVLEKMAHSLLPRVAARIGNPVDELRNRISIQLGASANVNGYTATFDGHTLVVINSALMIFLFKMIKVFVASLGVGDEDHPIERPLPEDRVVTICKALMDAFWEDRLSQQEGLWLVDLGEGQIRAVTRLLQLCESFAVAHEFGHVVVQSSTNPVPEEGSARSYVAEFLHLPDLDETAKNTLIEPWTEELCADLVGLDLVLSLSSTDPYNQYPHPARYIFDAVEVFHILLTMLTEYRDRTKHGTHILLGPTHPHGFLRMRAARRSRAAAGASGIGGFQMGSACFQFMNKVLIEIFGETAPPPDALRQHSGKERE